MSLDRRELSAGLGACRLQEVGNCHALACKRDTLGKTMAVTGVLLRAYEAQAIKGWEQSVGADLSAIGLCTAGSRHRE